MKLREILSEILNEISLTFKDEMLGHSHGQNDMSLMAYSGNTLAGTLDYSEYEGTPSVKMIEVKPEFRRQGVGTKLLKELQSMYSGIEIELGMLSDDGAALVKTLSRKFIPNKDYTKAKSRFDKTKSEIDRIMKDVESGNRSEIEKLNDLHDDLYDLEATLNDMPEGNWIIT